MPRFVNVFGACENSDCNFNCKSCDTEPGGDDKHCGYCGHHQAEHAKKGVMNMDTGKIEPISEPAASVSASKNTGKPFTTFFAPKFTAPLEEAKNLFSASAALAVKKNIRKPAKSNKSTASRHKEENYESDENDFSIAAVYVLPMDAQALPTTATAQALLERHGKLWVDYVFTTADDVLKQIKLRGGLSVATLFGKHQFFIYMVERLRKWVATGCSHLHMPTSKDIKAWKIDLANGKRLVIVPECDAADEHVFDRAGVVDLVNEDSDPPSTSPAPKRIREHDDFEEVQEGGSSLLSNVTASPASNVVRFLQSAGILPGSAQWQALAREMSGDVDCKEDDVENTLSVERTSSAASMPATTSNAKAATEEEQSAVQEAVRQTISSGNTSINASGSGRVRIPAAAPKSTSVHKIVLDKSRSVAQASDTSIPTDLAPSATSSKRLIRSVPSDSIANLTMERVICAPGSAAGQPKKGSKKSKVIEMPNTNDVEREQEK